MFDRLKEKLKKISFRTKTSKAKSKDEPSIQSLVNEDIFGFHVEEEEEEEFERSYHNLYKSHSKLVNDLKHLMEVLSNVARNVDLNLNDEEKFVCFESKKLAQSHIDVSEQFMLYVTKIYPR
jgi:hypothetical protein